MKLIHRSQRAREAVHSTSSSGDVFVGAVIVIMLLAVLGDIIGPILLGEAGMELALFDMGGETAVIAFQHWSLLEMMLAAGAVALGVSVIRTEIRAAVRTMVSALIRGLGKVPI